MEKQRTRDGSDEVWKGTAVVNFDKVHEIIKKMVTWDQTVKEEQNTSNYFRTLPENFALAMVAQTN